MPVSSRGGARKSRSYADKPLKSYSIPSYKDGYNSYSLTRSQIKDTEISGGQNTKPDDNGAMSKRAGKAIASPSFNTGYPIAAMGQLKKSGTLTKLLANGTGVYAFTDSTSTLLTGATFTPTVPEYCRFMQAIGRTYYCNGIDQPYYTTDGTTLNLQGTAFPMRYPTFYNQRLYCVRSQYPDRIYYSNPLAVDITTTGSEPSGYTAGGFGTYDVNLGASPIKNAGFIILLPDSGVVITNLLQKGNIILVHTLEHGEWEITASAALNTNGTVSHSVTQTIRSGGCPAPGSVFVSDNDTGYFGGDNFYYYGEVALYSNPRVTPKSGRVQSDMRSIPSLLKSKVAGVQFLNSEYIAYGVGTFNDRVLVRNKVLNAWSTPYVGWNVSCFFVVNELDGRQRLLAGSSDPSDPRVYELEVGFDDAGVVIDASFRDKNSSCGFPGYVKRFARANIFYSIVVGYESIDVYIDGVYSNTYTIQAPNSNLKATGVGSQKVGQAKVGEDFVGAASSISVLSDSYYVIDLGYVPGEKIEFVYRNSATGNQFRNLGREVFFDLGEIEEQLN